MHRRKLIILILLIFALVLFAYEGKEFFFQQAKGLIKQKLERKFPCRFSVEKIRAGLFYGLVLENLEIGFPQDLGLACNIKIDQAFIDYNLWRNVFARVPQAETARFLSSDLEFVLRGGQISFGKSSPLFKKLGGKISLSQKGLIFEDLRAAFKNTSRQTMKLCGRLSEDEVYLTANLEHLRVGNFDILTNLVLTLNKKLNLPDNATKICGTFKTYGSVLDNRPAPELNSSFEIQDNKLRILKCSLGDSYDLRGIVSLSSPFSADLSLNFHQAALNELLCRFDLPNEPDFSGLVNGLIKLTGELKHPRVDGYLEAKAGHIGDLDFVSADINIKGQYPRISIVDSRICREEDSFLMEGEIDFTALAGRLDLEKQDFLDIKLESDKGMLWQGWDITRKRGNQMHISKNIGDDVKISFDSFESKDDKADILENDCTNELGVEYRIFGDNLLKLRLRKEEEIFGLERRIKF